MTDESTELFLQEGKRIVIDNFLLIGFCFAVVMSLLYPSPGRYLFTIGLGDTHTIDLLNNFCVFFVSGLTLRIEALKAILKHKWTIVYSLVTINFTSTLVSLVLMKLPFLSPGFKTGVTIFSTVPATLGVGVALTQLSKGDQVLSLFLTVVSNLLGIVTAPFLLHIYLHGSTMNIDPLSLAAKLTIAVLIPTLVGMSVRKYVSGVPEFTKKHSTELSMFSTLNLVMIVWMALSTARNGLISQHVSEIFYVVGIVLVVHLLYLSVNYLVVSEYVLNLPVEQAVSVIIMASQKSCPVALALISSIPTADPQQQGLFAIPCVIGQLVQIFVGSLISKRLAQWVETKTMIANRERKYPPASLLMMQKYKFARYSAIEETLEEGSTEGEDQDDESVDIRSLPRIASMGAL